MGSKNATFVLRSHGHHKLLLVVQIERDVERLVSGNLAGSSSSGFFSASSISVVIASDKTTRSTKNHFRSESKWPRS